MPATPHTPVKDTWYLRRRYFRYPYFHYDVWAARGNGKLLAYVVTRTVTAEETGCVPVVRLVDFIGEDAVLPRLGGALDAILNRAGGEYMDCYSRRSLAGRRFYRAAGGRRQRHPQLSDPSTAGKHRVLLLYQQAGKLCTVQG